MLGGKKKQRSGVECVGSGGVPWRRLFSLHTLGTELASAPRQSHVSSLRAVYFRCSSQNVSFDPEYCSVRVSVVSGQIWRWYTGPTGPLNGEHGGGGERCRKQISQLVRD